MEKLKFSGPFFDVVFNHLPAAVILWNENAQIVSANRAALKLFERKTHLTITDLPQKMITEIKSAFLTDFAENFITIKHEKAPEKGEKTSGQVFLIKVNKIQNEEKPLYLTWIEDYSEAYRKELAANQFRNDILSELKIAKRVQKHLNNSILDLIEGRYLKYHFYSAFYPSNTLSGDVMNIRIINRRFTSAFIGDGKGHGVPAAMYSGLLYSYLNMFGLQVHNAEIDITGAVTQINALAHDDFSKGGEVYFFSGIFLIIDGDGTEVKVLNAGHPPGYFYSNERLHPIEGTGPLIGVSKDAFYQYQSFHLAGDEVFVLYTDGLSELANEKGELYGDSAMRDFLYQYLREEKSDHTRLHASLLKNALEFSNGSETTDDISILVMTVSRK